MNSGVELTNERSNARTRFDPWACGGWSAGLSLPLAFPTPVVRILDFHPAAYGGSVAARLPLSNDTLQAKLAHSRHDRKPAEPVETSAEAMRHALSVRAREASPDSPVAQPPCDPVRRGPSARRKKPRVLPTACAGMPSTGHEEVPRRGPLAHVPPLPGCRPPARSAFRPSYERGSNLSLISAPTPIFSTTQ